MKKKILLVSPYFPFPPYDGGKVRILNLIKHLSLSNDLILLSYVETREAQLRYAPLMEKICKKVHTVVREEENRLITADIPRSPTFHYTQQMIEKLGSIISCEKPDIIQIEFLVMTQYVNHVSGIPVCYTEHDMSSINFEQSYHDRDMEEKFRYVEWTKLVNYHKQVLRKFDGVVVLTDRDCRILDDFAPGLDRTIVPTGVDVRYYSPADKRENDSKNIVFIGHYKHYPNVDAVRYFMENIWGMITEKVPDAKFYIVGSGPGQNIKQYSSQNVIVTEDVEDVRQYLLKAAVFVAPVRLGGGIKGKVLEAMASGVPVVATPEVCAGFYNDPGNDIVKAETDAEFAEKTVALLNNPVERSRIAGNARKLVEKHYGWEKIAASLDSFYDSILEKYRH